MSMTNKKKSASFGIPRIESLRVENYRALRDVEFKDLTPMTVLLGPNGSGKSTVFDVFNFLSECFQSGLRHAWDRRGRSKELKSRGADGPVRFQLKYRERPDSLIITYALAIDEGTKGPEVVEESLRWRRQQHGTPFKFLDFQNGEGNAVSGEEPDEKAKRVRTSLRSPDLIAVNTLGQLSDHPRIAALREFITDWYVSYLSVERTREQPEAGPQERLSKSGDNLPNVIQYEDVPFQIVNRIVIEELESWYFGDWEAVRSVYPKVPSTITSKQQFRDPDGINGGTWEALERIFQRAGYFKSGLRKIELARNLASRMEPERNSSRSFQVFVEAIEAAKGF